MKTEKIQLQFLYLVTGILAACSLVYELLLAQTISFFMAHTVTWYSLTIGLYLWAMGIGAYFCNRIVKAKDFYSGLWHVEILLIVLGGMAVIVVHLAYIGVSYFFIKNTFVNLIGVFLLVFSLMVLLIGFLTGLELPLLIKAGNTLSPNRKITNRILAMDYFGSLLGGLLFALVLIRHFELLTIGLLMALCNLLVAFLLLFVFVGKPVRRRNIAIAGFLSFILLVGFFKTGSIQQYFLQRYYFIKEFSKDIKTLLFSPGYVSKTERISTPYQKIDIVKFSQQEDPSEKLLEVYSKKFRQDAFHPRGYAMFLDSFFQFHIDSEEIYHEYFAHVPVVVNAKVPKRVLILGAGDGLLVRELVKYKEIEKIVLVEIDKKVVELAKTHPILKYVNHGSLEDKRITFIFSDAYHYVKETKEVFDAIYMDFPDANDYDLSKLYSREFYFFMRKCLSDDGYAVLDAPGMKICTPAEKSSELESCKLLDIYGTTLFAAGFKTILPFTTTLEADNQEARKLMEEVLKNISGIVMIDSNVDGKFVTESNTKEAMVTHMINSFIDHYRQGFIMVKKEKEEMSYFYKDMGIDCYVLNEKRFYLSVKDGLYQASRDKDKVNSIMRSVLPQGYTRWHVRLPY